MSEPEIPLSAFEPLPVEFSAIVGETLLRDFDNFEVGVGDGNDAYHRAQTDLQGAAKVWKRCDDGFPVWNGGSILSRVTFVDDEARGLEQREVGLRARHKVTGRVVFLKRNVGDYGRKGAGAWTTDFRLVF